MTEVIERITYHDTNGGVKEVDTCRIICETGTKVVFVDNSFLGDLDINGKNSYPAGTQGGHPKLTGVVCRTNSTYQSYNKMFNRTTDHPIVVKAEDGRVYYCNPLNITPILHL